MIEKAHIIDEKIIGKVVEMGYDRDKILEALNLGPDLLTKHSKPKNTEHPERSLSEYGELRQMAVAYHLTQDHENSKVSCPLNEDSSIGSPKSSIPLSPRDLLNNRSREIITAPLSLGNDAKLKIDSAENI